MQRLTLTPRPDKASKLEAIGLSFHAWDDYWNEAACYRFNAQQVDELEAATEKLHAMCLQAVGHVIAQGRLAQLGFPKQAHALIDASWQKREPSLYGRFDLAYDGHSPPRMLEYNADTPTSLLESAVAQWYWLQDVFPQADQFNSLHERLVERWQQLGVQGPLHIASLDDNEEDWVCTPWHYLKQTVPGSVGEPARVGSSIEAAAWVFAFWRVAQFVLVAWVKRTQKSCAAMWPSVHLTYQQSTGSCETQKPRASAGHP